MAIKDIGKSIKAGLMAKEKQQQQRNGGTPSLREQQQMLCQNLSFTAAEAYKLLRTNLMYTLPAGKRCRVIGMTSSVRGEGKTTTSINLSYTLAETGAKVLLVDADMRLPSVAKRLELDNHVGLSTILAGLCRVEDAIQPTGIVENWCVIPSGEIPPNPSELLGSGEMGRAAKILEQYFDFIVYDLPPVNIVSDASTISPVVDGMLVAVRQDYSDRRSLGECMRQLKLLNTRVLGFVMTDTQEGKQYGHYKYGKYGSRYGRNGWYGRYGKYGKRYLDRGYGYGYGEQNRGTTEKQ